MIETYNLVKKYKNGFKALDNINLNVKEGEIFALLGENGAGKSTLIDILTTLSNPTSGKVNILSKELNEENKKYIRQNISCVYQNVSLEEHLTLIENMIFQSEIYKLKNSKKQIDFLIETFNLQNFLLSPVFILSGGIKRRLDIAMSLIQNPKILFLDEPTLGLDITSRISLQEIIKKINLENKTTIFLTTHYLEEASYLSDSVFIIKNGKKITYGKKDISKNIFIFDDSNFYNKSLEEIFLSITENKIRTDDNVLS